MSNKPPESDRPDLKPTFRNSVLRNWISLAGMILAAGSVLSFSMLFVIDLATPGSNAYVGILAYLVSPMFLTLGLLLMGLGWYLQRRRYLKGLLTGGQPALLTFDLTRPRDRRNLIILVGSSCLFMLLSAVGSYHTYHFTESVEFCGQACHTVMEPEFTTYQHSPHARVSCVECHIGSGAGWYVKSKLSGLYQVYSTMFDKYHRPIETPLANLRPAAETCEQCHWPEKFVGNLDRNYYHFLTDEDNPPYNVRLSLKVGGGDPTHGPVSGIHWHMSVSNRVEYVASDEKKQVIPWVRITNPQGVVTEYVVEDFEGPPTPEDIRVMDCMDCHNRPSHIFKNPNEAVDLALWLGRMDPAMPLLKYNAVDLLSQPYETVEEAMTNIATRLSEEYQEDPRLSATISEVQTIYRRNFFPKMKADWRVYPDNIGHKEWPGCFRCHDGKHHSLDGTKTLEMNNCNDCHTLLAEGSGEEFNQISPQGLEFKHMDLDIEGFLCHECHTGANE